jgi:hypothetical protein
MDLPKPSRELLPRPSPMPPHPDDVASAAKLLAGAERVVVLAGLGAVEAGAAPLAARWPRRPGGCCRRRFRAGLFHDDPFCIGISGSFTPEVGLEYLKEADFVIAVGCSLAYHAGGGGQLWPKAKMLQIDIDPVAVSQGQEVARHHLRADARLGVEALTAALPARKRSWRSEQMAARIRDSKPDSQAFEIEPGLLDPRRVVEALEEALPQEWEMVNSGGHCSWFFAQMPSRRRRSSSPSASSARSATASRSPWAWPPRARIDRGAVRRRRQPDDARAGARDHQAPRAEHPHRGDERRRVRLRGAQAALGGMPEEGRCSATAISRASRGDSGFGKDVKDLDELPKLVAEFAASGGAAVWDFHVSDKVVSPTIRRAHPHPARK